jgi:4-amino-4-deoxy-L-arabinose transferase-like glycosyltransferase
VAASEITGRSAGTAARHYTEELLAEKSWKFWASALLCCAALFLLYFFGLTRAGLLGPDEPRYAAIGRAMAESGDWVTPRLWGQPWFEKPALLYWMTAAAFKTGLDSDWAPRLPVALASVAFLVCFFLVLRRQFGHRAAFYSAAILATSAGWLAFSHVAVTDLPMSAALAAAMLMVMREPSGVPASLASGVLLGAAVLGKGLVPLALFLPALWFLRRQPRNLLLLMAAATFTAAPWYALVTFRNGVPFLEEFFWKHHFARFVGAALQHPQPLWFYAPVLAAGLFPWSPFLLLLFWKRIYQRRQAVFLLLWFAFGFVFFSASRNKLPGYLLPLLPALAALIGFALAEMRPRSARVTALVAAGAASLVLLPMIQDLLPNALLSGLSHTQFRLPLGWVLPALLASLAAAALERTGRRASAIALIALLATLSVGRLVWQVYPELDRQVSARSLWNSQAESITCVSDTNRSRRYGLDYYAGRALPDCN